ncbi:YcgL domain-containing protein [Catenovulum sediminis]|uniref:YcgL domain-containing protein n=1 Tax=Catenovulum sediminis TaxID=1740262 RepID=UPI00117DB8EE|nr:YcgL domain-containing protein [Catenovulum sediminis]
MLCAVYRSHKKADTYLYVTKRDDFSRVPEPLMASFGQPIFVLMCNLDKRDKLGTADLKKVRADLTEHGFYLQLPPPSENMLDELKARNKRSDSND